MADRTQTGLCNDPGPGDLHCTKHRLHDYSCYDAQDDSSWNDNQWEMGWFDDHPHKCDDPTCPGR